MPDFSQDVAILWEKFIKLNKGCEQIGYVEIDAYQRITGNTLEHWEIDLVIEIDSMRRSNG